MADPQVYDLSYRMNQSGIFIPPELISNFGAGESFVMNRKIVKAPRPVAGITFIAKASQGAPATMIRKVIGTDLGPDGQLVLNIDGSYSLTLLFTPSETLLFDGKRYFFMDAEFDDTSSSLLSRGWMRAAAPQTVTTGAVASITISDVPGASSIGTFQIHAYAVDVNGLHLTGIPLLYFSSNTNVATVNDTGLVTARVVGQVNITVATTQGSVSRRITLGIT